MPFGRSVCHHRDACIFGISFWLLSGAARRRRWYRGVRGAGVLAHTGGHHFPHDRSRIGIYSFEHRCNGCILLFFGGEEAGVGALIRSGHRESPLMPIDPVVEMLDQSRERSAKQRNRREPLTFAYVGLILFMVVYFARPGDWIPGLSAIPFAKILGILIVVALFFSFASIHWHIPLEISFLGLLIVQLWLSAAFSPVWRGGAVKVMLDFSKVLPLVVVMFGVVRSLKRLGWILFVQAASVAAIAIVSILNRHTLGGRLQSALSGMSGDPNDLAVLIDITLPLCLALALTTRSRWKQLAWIAAMLAMLYAVFLTGSRAGALALLIVSGVCIWKLGVRGRRPYLFMLVPVAVIAFWAYGGDTLRGRLEDGNSNGVARSQTSEAAASTEQRKELLLQSLRITAQHPFFGVGAGNFEVVSGVWHVTHNSYTQMSAEGGIAALILYMLVLWRGITNLENVVRSRRSTRGARLVAMLLEASLLGYLVGSFFLSLAYHLFPYCLIAYTSALRIITSNYRLDSNAESNRLIAVQLEVDAWN